jgi:hypothetical protein
VPKTDFVIHYLLDSSSFVQIDPKCAKMELDQKSGPKAMKETRERNPLYYHEFKSNTF